MCGADGMWNPDPATYVCTCECLPMAYILAMYNRLQVILSIYFVHDTLSSDDEDTLDVNTEYSYAPILKHVSYLSQVIIVL